MTADLRAATVEVGDVVRVERLGALVELTVMLPHLAATAMPGQFAQLRCGDGPVPLLRRPMSVAWVDGDECTFVFEEVGSGTRLLAALAPGDSLDVLGPLGTGFSLDAQQQNAVIISGGVGCAPFPLLIRALSRRSVRSITVLSGAATASHLYPASRFRRDGAADVLEITDDGSSGRCGLVTDLIAEAMRDDVSVYACGPNRMLAAVWERLRLDDRTTGIVEASLEAPMGCGYGTCLGCALPVRADDAKTRWALCCSEGPVMSMRDVDWDAVCALPGADVA